MMFRTAMAMLVHQRRSTLVATLVVAAATFLILFQMSVYLGFRADTTVILDAFDADLWIAPRHQPSFDGYVSIDDRPFHVACSTAGIASSGRVIWEYAPWRLPKSGSLDCIQILGLDTNSSMVPELSVTIPTAGSTVDEKAFLSNVQVEGHVLVGRKSMRQLEVDRPGVAGCEINERHGCRVWRYVRTLPDGRSHQQTPDPWWAVTDANMDGGRGCTFVGKTFEMARAAWMRRRAN